MVKIYYTNKTIADVDPEEFGGAFENRGASESDGQDAEANDARNHYVDVEYVHLKRSPVLTFLISLVRANYARANALLSDPNTPEHRSVEMFYWPRRATMILLGVAQVSRMD